MLWRNEEAQSMSHVAAAQQTARILFVDDDANILAAADNLLRALGKQVTIARTRAEALAELGGGKYDVLMTDLTMPECSGWDLARQSKARFPDKPVVLVTGWGLTLDADETKMRLVNGILSKPFTLDELQRALNDAAK
ncbi:MAG: hypothetical protein BroJett039_00620 [Chloroflexota bacterium]|jgi:CheY-like chemotaxis protein|nr:MAG: hypothetical protein B6D41_10630 [Chloroflexi bacterium UTCFX4]GIL14889.1 MAG: hypothetical protein BroJett039_00620 [Chloroflexota bacterium]